MGRERFKDTCFQPTYEELKLNALKKHGYRVDRFQPTYEELKHGHRVRVVKALERFQPTYEELKHASRRIGATGACGVSSLPMRN